MLPCEMNDTYKLMLSRNMSTPFSIPISDVSVLETTEIAMVMQSQKLTKQSQNLYKRRKFVFSTFSLNVGTFHAY